MECRHFRTDLVSLSLSPPGSFTLAAPWWSREILLHFWKLPNCFRSFSLFSFGTLFWSHREFCISTLTSLSTFRLLGCPHLSTKRSLAISTRVKNMSNLNLEVAPKKAQEKLLKLSNMHMRTRKTKKCPRILSLKQTRMAMLSPFLEKMSSSIPSQRSRRLAKKKFPLSWVRMSISATLVISSVTSCLIWRTTNTHTEENSFPVIYAITTLHQMGKC